MWITSTAILQHEEQGAKLQNLVVSVRWSHYVYTAKFGGECQMISLCLYCKIWWWVSDDLIMFILQNLVVSVRWSHYVYTAKFGGECQMISLCLYCKIWWWVSDDLIMFILLPPVLSTVGNKVRVWFCNSYFVISQLFFIHCVLAFFNNYLKLFPLFFNLRMPTCPLKKCVPVVLPSLNSCAVCVCLSQHLATQPSRTLPGRWLAVIPSVPNRWSRSENRKKWVGQVFLGLGEWRVKP